ncbi:MAG: futalosine hydrolase [Actinoplanes sp.]
MTYPLLVVTAVAAEANAVRAGADPRHVVVEPVGVGPAAAAAGTARLLAAGRYRAVVSAGIAGGFPGRAPVGSTVLGTRSIAADLGAETPDGFLPVDDLGFGSSVVEADAALVKALAAALPGAITGEVLTLSTVTGTAATAARLAERFPSAVAEAMEGYGVAVAAAGLPFVELRTISNPIGPRDRTAWRLKEAFAALSTASAALWTACG